MKSVATTSESGTESGRRAVAFGLLITTFVIWAHSFIAARLLVGDDVPMSQRLTPLEFVEARFATVALWCLLWFVFRRTERREAVALLTRRPLILALLAFVNVWGYNLAFGAGHERVPAGTGSLIIVLNPILTYLMVTAIGQERPTLRRTFGLLVAFVGVYWVITRGAGQRLSAAYLEDALLLLLAPLSWTVYTVFSKPLLAATPPPRLTYLVLGLGSLPALLLALFDTSLIAKLSAWPLERFFAAGFLGLGCSVLAFWLWFEALSRLPASTAAAFVFLNPPLTLLFDWLWFGRMPSAGLLTGGAVVLAGVYLTVTEPRDRRR